MFCRYITSLAALAILVLFVSPGAASLVLSNVAFTPDAPLVPGGLQKVVATYAVIPSGSTTFARGHSLQMQTNLSNAMWNIQVTLDGRDAARQTATGSAAFVNGEILSYPTTRDVGLVVTVEGTVPSGTSGSVNVLTVKELDNGGNTVPGSDLAISQPAAGSVTAVATTALPALTPPVATTAAPERAPGFSAPIAFLALIAGVLVLRSGTRNQ
ncbi:MULTISPECIES: hypothetical protein [unclassified Methanoregula]|uniref:hypothetical protein n=1 Tax=unclassified Methanoregula TaxID=2649730 RepID=UPI0009C503C1|nr:MULTISPECIES: hypothetical protein [unclassified Methanoregula]OPX62274.1 MAG: hypothetical protein A4E33_02343 [Methanoregula sp. PtaB.Bin085]OPY32701.1 MAG: hypothetical protein A4E34_02077 [Methanoregula sp. PtaU1.Bin006]